MAGLCHQAASTTKSSPSQSIWTLPWCLLEEDSGRGFNLIAPSFSLSSSKALIPQQPWGGGGRAHLKETALLLLRTQEGCQWEPFWGAEGHRLDQGPPVLQHLPAGTHRWETESCRHWAEAALRGKVGVAGMGAEGSLEVEYGLTSPGGMGRPHPLGPLPRLCPGREGAQASRLCLPLSFHPPAPDPLEEEPSPEKRVPCLGNPRAVTCTA